MSASRYFAYAVASASIVLSTTGCEWFSDFKRQPSLSTWEVRTAKDSLSPSRGSPQYSVPVTGSAVAGYQVSYAALPGTIDSMAPLVNPTRVSEASLVNGRKYFQINCSVCHGEKGMGDGPATKFGMPGINLIGDVTKARTDGYIFGMIRNGRGLMPPYNRIEEMDRWDVVNYVRGLQGLLGQVVPTGPLAAPGVTGDKVPGFSQSAPTRPAPFLKPGMEMTRPSPPLDSVASRQPSDTAISHQPSAVSRADSAPAGIKR
ncbi:MAG TPA: cytochrome c [Gemmatimonadaceae bacterium]|nr:cytochrome c [Gemmatimonadaceae bacterium]